MPDFQDFQKVSRAYSDASIMMHQAIAHRAGLSATDHKYLGLLMQKEAMTAGEISQATGLTTGAVTGLIDRLERQGLVARKADKSDRRKTHIVPNSQKAMDLLRPLFTDLQKKTEQLFNSFEPAEMMAIVRYFQSATEIMTEISQKLIQQRP